VLSFLQRLPTPDQLSTVIYKENRPHTKYNALIPLQKKGPGKLDPRPPPFNSLMLIEYRVVITSRNIRIPIADPPSLIFRYYRSQLLATIPALPTVFCL